MRNPTRRDLRNAVVLAILLTAIVMLALLDPSCRPKEDSRQPDSRSMAPP